MKILVPVKRVIDPYVKIRVLSDGSGVETKQVKMAMNPFDEIALEEALRLKEAGLASEVICVSIGLDAVNETLRHGLALGACRAIWLEAPNDLNSLQVAKALKQVVTDEDISLVLMGKQAIDSDANQTGQMLGALLDWPQATFVSKIDVRKTKAFITRETDLGLEELEVTLPAVISVDLRLNEPRYATLPNIMKAKSKPLLHLQAELDNNDFSLENLSIISPPMRSKGERLDSVDQLIEKLKPLITG